MLGSDMVYPQYVTQMLRNDLASYGSTLKTFEVMTST